MDRERQIDRRIKIKRSMNGERQIEKYRKRKTIIERDRENQSLNRQRNIEKHRYKIDK